MYKFIIRVMTISSSSFKPNASNLKNRLEILFVLITYLSFLKINCKHFIKILNFEFLNFIDPLNNFLSNTKHIFCGHFLN